MGKVLFNTLLFISRGYPTKDTRRWVKMTAPPKLMISHFPRYNTTHIYIHIYVYYRGDLWSWAMHTWKKSVETLIRKRYSNLWLSIPKYTSIPIDSGYISGYMILASFLELGHFLVPCLFIRGWSWRHFHVILSGASQTVLENPLPRYGTISENEISWNSPAPNVPRLFLCAHIDRKELQ